MKKTYTTSDLTIGWEAEKCIHSTNCWKGLGLVFQPKERPWIKTENASPERIAQQIDKCPSGALSYTWNNGEKETTENIVHATIEAKPNGPLLIHGNITLKHSNGNTEQKEKMTAFCRCGMSANKPFCDGTHRKEDWKE